MAKKCPFKKNKQYYYPDEDWKIKFVEETLDGYYLFKYVQHEELDELLTKKIDKIWENKREYLKYIKENGVEDENK